MNERAHFIDGKRVGIQHCDIKPSNILLIGESAKLADFGISTALATPVSAYQQAGTVDFAAPEMHRALVSDRSDQYSLAVTYYYLRTANFPFPPPPQGNFSRSYSADRPEADLSGVAPAERFALARALDPVPERRWPSCSDLISELFGLDSARAAGFESSVQLRPRIPGWSDDPAFAGVGHAGTRSASATSASPPACTRLAVCLLMVRLDTVPVGRFGRVRNLGAADIGRSSRGPSSSAGAWRRCPRVRPSSFY